MTYNNSLKLPQLGNSTLELETKANNGSNYRPSVPLAIYRELAEQLQTTQDRLSQLQAENQILATQNTQLRQELQEITNNGQKLQHLVNELNFSAQSLAPKPETKTEVTTQEEHFQEQANSTLIPSEDADKKVETVLAKADSHAQSSLSSANSATVNGWLLAIAIVFIILTAFGTGFLLINPFLGDRDS